MPSADRAPQSEGETKPASGAIPGLDEHGNHVAPAAPEEKAPSATKAKPAASIRNLLDEWSADEGGIMTHREDYFRSFLRSKGIADVKVEKLYWDRNQFENRDPNRRQYTPKADGMSNPVAVWKVSGDGQSILIERPSHGEPVKEYDAPKTPDTETPAPKRSFRRPVPEAPSGHDAIESLLHDIGQIVHPETARREQLKREGKTVFQKTTNRGGEYDQWMGLPQQLRALVFGKVGETNHMAPDSAAQAAYDQGLIRQPTPDALREALASAWQTRLKVRNEGRAQAREEKAAANTVRQQDANFAKDTANPASGAKIPAESLSVGDTVELGGQRLKVTDVDPDNGDVTLEDHSRYGIQHVKDGQFIYGELEKGKTSSDFLPEDESPQTPKLRPGEKGTADLFQKADAPFNLAGEKGVDWQKREQEKADDERAKREAKEKQDRDQTNLFSSKERGETLASSPERDERARNLRAYSYDEAQIVMPHAAQNMRMQPGQWLVLENGRPVAVSDAGSREEALRRAGGEAAAEHTARLERLLDMSNRRSLNLDDVQREFRLSRDDAYSLVNDLPAFRNNADAIRRAGIQRSERSAVPHERQSGERWEQRENQAPKIPSEAETDQAHQDLATLFRGAGNHVQDEVRRLTEEKAKIDQQARASKSPEEYESFLRQRAAITAKISELQGDYNAADRGEIVTPADATAAERGIARLHLRGHFTDEAAAKARESLGKISAHAEAQDYLRQENARARDDQRARREQGTVAKANDEARKHWEGSQLWQELLDAKERPANTRLANLWRSVDDGAFRYPKTDARSAEDVARDMSTPRSQITGHDDGQNVRFRSGRGWLDIEDAHGPAPTIGASGAQSAGREAGGGSQLYQAALAWAHNNGVKITPSHALTHINAYVRRTSNMLSSALRFGTTKHMEPDPAQEVPWKRFDHNANIANLARREAHQVFLALPQLRGLTFDFADHTFRNENGDILDNDALKRLLAADPENSFDAGIGLGTLQRAVITRSAERGAGIDSGRGSSELRDGVRRGVGSDSSTGETHGEQLRGGGTDRDPQLAGIRDVLYSAPERAGEPQVDDKDIRSYLQEKGVDPHDTAAQQNIRELATVRNDGPDYQLPLFPGGDEAGQRVSGSGGEAGNVRGRGQSDNTALIAQRRAENAGIANPAGPEAREALRTRGRVSSLIPELIKTGAKDWNVRGTVIQKPADAFKLLQVVRSPYIESLKVAVLDSKGRVHHSEIVSIGSLNESVAHPREIMRAIQRIADEGGPRNLLIGHNHPSGDPSPSDADRRLTDRFQEIAQRLGFHVVDHVITNGERYFSFKEAGLLSLTHPKPDPMGLRAPREPEALRQAKNDPNQLADWETVPRSAAVHGTPDQFRRVVASLRNADPNAGHIFYMSTRMGILGMERVEDMMKMAPADIEKRLVSGASREGAYAVALHFPGEYKAGEKALRYLREGASLHRVNLLDGIFDDRNAPGGLMSAMQSGIMEEGPGTRTSETESETPAKPRASIIPGLEHLLESPEELDRSKPETESDPIAQREPSLAGLARDEIVDKLAERPRNMIKARMAGWTPEEMGAEFGLPEDRAQQAAENVAQGVKARLVAKGIDPDEAEDVLRSSPQRAIQNAYNRAAKAVATQTGPVRAELTRRGLRDSVAAKKDGETTAPIRRRESDASPESALPNVRHRPAVPKRSDARRFRRRIY